MIPALRKQFNANFTPEKYQTFLKVMDERCGTPVQFRLSETPCFFPKALLDQMSEYGKQLIQQLGGLEYRKTSFRAIPPEFNVPHEAPHPMFIQVDFGLVRDASGKLQPRLVELQGFPSLYAYQAMLSQVYMEVFELDENLQCLLGGLDWEGYKKLLRRAIVADHDPENVILMEIDPLHQKTLPDFLLTEKLLGYSDGRDHRHREKRQCSFSTIEKAGDTPIQRIYNRAIVDELVRKNLTLPFPLSRRPERGMGRASQLVFPDEQVLPALPASRVRSQDPVPRSCGTRPRRSGELRHQAAFFLRRAGSPDQSQQDDLAAIPREKRRIHPAGTDELRAGHRNSRSAAPKPKSG